MDKLALKKSWNLLDLFLFFVRTVWISTNASKVILLYEDPQIKWSFFALFLLIYLGPYCFYRPGMFQPGLYVAAESIFTGAMFCFLMHEFQMMETYNFLYLPFLMIGYACRTKLLKWLGAVLITAVFWAGSWLGQFFAGEQLLSFFIQAVLFYGFGLLFGQITNLNMKTEELLQFNKQKSNMLEEYTQRIEQLTITEERSRVSQELTETAGHIFTFVAAELEQTAGQTKEKAEQTICRLADLTREEFDKVRRKIHELAPEKHTETISSLLSGMAGEFGRYSGTRVTFQIKGSEQMAGEPLTYALIRFLQEALMRAKTHGEASEVEVTLVWTTNTAVLLVQDNGKVPAAGLEAIDEKLAALGGALSVEFSPGAGSRIVCTVPLQEAAG